MSEWYQQIYQHISIAAAWIQTKNLMWRLSFQEKAERIPAASAAAASLAAAASAVRIRPDGARDGSGAHAGVAIVEAAAAAGDGAAGPQARWPSRSLAVVRTGEASREGLGGAHCCRCGT